MNFNLMYKLLIHLLIPEFIYFAVGEDVNPAETEYLSIRKLRAKLFANYNKHSQPIQDYSNTTSVSFRFAEAYCFQYDERNETFTIEGTFILKWNDSRLVWNPSEYGGIDFLPLEAEEIWLPDIGIYESVPAQIMTRKHNTKPVVQPRGQIMWAARGVFKTLCLFNADGYPRNIQACNMTFGSWTEDGLSIDFQVGSSNVELKNRMLGINNNWKLLDFKVTRVINYITENAYPFVNIVVTTRFQRYSPIENKVVAPPVTAATILMISMFWLPPSSKKKLTLGATALFMLLGLLLYVAASVKSPIVIGIAVSYIRSVIFITVSALLSEIVVIIISKLGMLPPTRLKNLIDSSMAKFLFLNSPNKPILNEELRVQDRSPEDTWYKTSMAMDRFFFILFVIICILNQILHN